MLVAMVVLFVGVPISDQGSAAQKAGSDKGGATAQTELPSGYGHAWASNPGEYVVTESPGFNPNVGSNLHWERLTPAK